MADSLPPWLQFKRTPRRTMEARTGEDAGAPVVGTSPATRPRRVGAPEQSLEDLGIPADAVRLDKVPEVAGVDENYTSVSEPGSVRPRRATVGGVQAAAAEYSRRFGAADPTAPIPEEQAEPGDSVTEWPKLPVPGRVEFDESQSATRARIADPAGRLEKQIAHERQNPAQDGNGWKGVMIDSLLGLLQRGVPGAAAAGVTNLLDKSSDERRAQGRRVGGYQRDLGEIRGREVERLKLDDARAGVRQKNAQAGYFEQRPDLERDKLDAATLDRKQKAIQREIGQRLRDPRPFDDKDAYDSDLAERAAESGVSMNRAGFGDAQKPFSIEVLDPTDAQHIQKIRMQFDRGTRQWSPVQAGGETVVTNRVQPVGDDGRTPSQRETDADRDRAFDATQNYRSQLLGLSSARLQEQMLNGLSGRSAREFTTQTRGLFERRGAVEREINDLSKRAASYTIDPADAQRRIKQLESERDGITGQIEASRGKALGSVAAPAAGSTSRRGAASTRAAGEWGEDPDVRAFADAYFKGDYGAAQMAIEEQKRRKR
jgi:hypothetical protein